MLHLVAGLGYDWACMSLISRGADSNLPVRLHCLLAVKQCLAEHVIVLRLPSGWLDCMHVTKLVMNMPVLC